MCNFKISLVIIFCGLFPAVSFCQTSDGQVDGSAICRQGLQTDPIANKLTSCLGRNFDPQGIGQCQLAAIHEYDAALNSIYQEALSHNNEVTQNAIRVSQRKWLAFSASDKAALSEYAKTTRGTILNARLGTRDTNMLHERICELMIYIDGNDP